MKERKILWGETSLLSLLLLGFIAVGVLVRFWQPLVAPFIHDEPLYMQMAEDALAAGKIPVVGMSGSSLPLPYGAGAIWFYQLLFALGLSFPSIIFVHLCLTSSSLFGIWYGARRAWGDEASLWALALAAVAPFLIYFGRHPWDVTLLLVISGGLVASIGALSAPSLASRRWPWLLFTAILCAWAVNIHLMSGPMVAGAIAAIFWNSWHKQPSRKLFWIESGLFLALILCLVAPYVIESLQLIRENKVVDPGKTFSRWGDARHFTWNIAFLSAPLSFWYAKMFFDPEAKLFLEWLAWPLGFLLRYDVLGWIPKLSFLGFLVVVGRDIFLRKKRVDSLTFFVFAASMVCLSMYQYLNVPMRPHYFLSLWLLPCLAAAAIVVRSVEWSRGWLPRVFLLSLSLSAIFSVSVLTYYVKFGGTRGMVMGTSLAVKMKELEAICTYLHGAGKTTATIDTSGIISTPGGVDIRYLVGKTKACSGLQLTIQKEPLESAEIRLRYPEDSTRSAFWRW